MKRQLLTVLLLLLMLVACGDKEIDPSKPVYVTIGTTMGDVTVLLYDDTPLHRDNFIRLCQTHAQDGVLFHRIIKDFVVQGGDPTSKARTPGVLYGDGDGGYTVPAEIQPNHYNKRGVLIDAKEMDADNPQRASAGTQFCFVQGKVLDDEELDQKEQRINEIHRNWLFYRFKDRLVKESPELAADSMLTELENRAMVLVEDTLALTGTIRIPTDRREVYKTVGGVPHLDGSVTIFGEVTEGLNIVEKISLVPTDKNDRPEKDVYVKYTKVFQK